MTTIVQELKDVAAHWPLGRSRLALFLAADEVAGRIAILAAEGTREALIEVNAAVAKAERIVREGVPQVA